MYLARVRQRHRHRVARVRSNPPARGAHRCAFDVFLLNVAWAIFANPSASPYVAVTPSTSRCSVVWHQTVRTNRELFERVTTNRFSSVTATTSGSANALKR